MTQSPSPGYPPPLPAAQPPNNYLVWAVLATIFCFPITGIAAIVKSMQVNGLWMQGQYAASQVAANSAKTWVKWSVIAWSILVLASGAIAAVLVLTAGEANAAMLVATL